MLRLLVDSIGEINLLSGGAAGVEVMLAGVEWIFDTNTANERNAAGARMLLRRKLGHMTLELKEIKKLLPMPKGVRDIEI